MSLKGKIVFITGASGGIGAATALAFAAEGARLLLAARRAAKLSEVASAALAKGAPAVHSIDLDVRDHRAVEGTVDLEALERCVVDVAPHACASPPSPQRRAAHDGRGRPR